MITCRNVQQLQNAFLDGELTPSLTAEVHAHLLQCPECQRQVEMLRACGDVIAKDAPEPALDSGFAQRVLAQLDSPGERAALTLPRRGRRERLMRIVSRAAFPAMAAMLFLAVWLLPPMEEKVEPPTMVAGEAVAVDAAGVRDMLDPTLSVVSETQQAARSLNRMIELGVGQARQGVSSHLGRPADKGGDLFGEFSVLDLLLQPINDMMAPLPVDPKDEIDEVVRL